MKDELLTLQTFRVISDPSFNSDLVSLKFLQYFVFIK